MKVPKINYSKALEQDFLKYEKARQTGMYNMVMDMNKIIAEYGISFRNYIHILNNYSELAKKYL